jgi:hypothetical protein
MIVFFDAIARSLASSCDSVNPSFPPDLAASISRSVDDKMSLGRTCLIKSSKFLTGGSRAFSICSVESVEGPMCRRAKVSRGRYAPRDAAAVGELLASSLAELV